jgi:lipopolysaccharide transport system permease protein
VWAGWGKRQLWWSIAYQDLIAAYRRSILGPFWITLQSFAFVLGISVVYGALFKIDFVEFLPYVAIGFLFWNLITSLVNGSTTAYVASSHYIRSSSLPLSMYAYKMAASQLILFAHTLLPDIILLIVLRIVPSPWAIIEVPAGTFLIVLNGVLLCLWLGPLSARYRDITPLVASAMQLMMFLTPVFWDPQSLPNRSVVAWNPFVYFLEVVRNPILNRPVDTLAWAVVIGITVINLIVAAVIFSRSRRWIAHWVS